MLMVGIGQICRKRGGYGSKVIPLLIWRMIMSRPSDLLVKRAVELWKRMLRSPKFDNGDNGPNGGMASMLATMIPTNTTEELLDKFGVELEKTILTPSEHSRDYYPNTSLHVDYGPDKALGDAAEAAGLKCQFPWKTNMWIGDGCVSVSAGYAAANVYHYPLDNGKWLVTSLSGSEIDKIKRFVTDGTHPEFMVE